MTDAELRVLLVDCLRVWGVEGRVEANEHAFHVFVVDAEFVLRRAAPHLFPTRWLLDTPARGIARHRCRPTPSIIAALAALRRGLEVATEQPG